jgi:IS30 family transposase
MSEKNNTTNVVKKQYHHLTKDDRVKIETLISLKDSKGKRLYSNTYIANEIGVDKATISRELRNRIKSKISVMTGKVKNKPYNAIDAQNDYKYKRAMSKAEYKLEKYPKMKKFIEDKILNDKWAPDVIVGYMKKHNYFKRKGFSSITMQTIYNAIRYNIIDVKVDDMRRMKYNPKYEYNETPEVKESKRDYTIEKRDKEIDKRLVFGHFELDTVLGKRDGVHECLMTITERKTRYEMIFKLSSKSADEVIHKFNQIKDFMKKNFDKVFKTITTDNGTEFSEFKEIIKDTKAKIYFCHPYCSGEKGSNERNNEIIRYFIPKSTLIENYSYEDINNIANWMNNYPRKILDYKTPLEALLEEFNDKSIINKLYKLQEVVNNV